MSGAKSGAATQTTSTSTQSKDARRRGQVNVQMVQNVLLIWLDGTIDKNSSDCQNTITHLRRVVNAVNIFTNGDECIQFLADMANEKACMIISGALSQHIVPRVHELAKIDSIFIFCGNKTYHEEWARKWPKIKGVFTEIKPICNALKKKRHSSVNRMPSPSVSWMPATLCPARVSISSIHASCTHRS